MIMFIKKNKRLTVFIPLRIVKFNLLNRDLFMFKCLITVKFKRNL